MMKLLFSSAEAARNAILAKIRTMKISDVKGEDVYHVVSLIRAAYRRLDVLHSTPQDFYSSVANICDEFNEHFRQFVKDFEKVSAVPTLAPYVQLPSLDHMLGLAEQLYLVDCNNGDWNKTHTPMSAWLLDAEGQPIRTCWNCGDTEHEVDSCPKPLNPSRIRINRTKYFNDLTKFREAQGIPRFDPREGGNKQKKPIPFKWRPPQPDENHKRVIDGVPHTWNVPDRWWYPTPQETPKDTTQALVISPPKTAPDNVLVTTPPQAANIANTKTAEMKAKITPELQQLYITMGNKIMEAMYESNPHLRPDQE